MWGQALLVRRNVDRRGRVRNAMIRYLPLLLLAACSAPAPQQPAPTPSPTPPPTVTPSPIVEPGSAAEAAQIVRRYQALLADRDYAGAHALWEPQAALPLDAFERGFAGYARYAAEVGTPSRVEPGAGQRYITVPITITGTLTDGTAVNRRGEVILHRLAEEIDGATVDQKRWRIREVRETP